MHGLDKSHMLISCLFLAGILPGTMIGWFIGARFGKRLLGVTGGFVGSACGFAGGGWVALETDLSETPGCVLVIILSLGGGAAGSLLLSSLFSKNSAAHPDDDPLDG